MVFYSRLTFYGIVLFSLTYVSTHSVVPKVLQLFPFPQRRRTSPCHALIQIFSLPCSDLLKTPLDNLDLELVMKVKVKSLSRVWLFPTPWTVAHQAPWSMGFSRHEYWSEVPFPGRSQSEKWTMKLSNLVWVCNSLRLTWILSFTRGKIYRSWWNCSTYYSLSVK